MPEFGWLQSVVTGRFFLRAGAYGLAAIVLALVAAPVSGFYPGLGTLVDETSIRDLLEVIAQTMLLVATFSLGTMVAAYTSASSIASPRATKVLIEDPISQTVISTFVGAFVFAIIGLVGLSLGIYGEEGRVLLLIATGIVVILVILMLFGWVDYLANLLRLGAVLNKVEAVAAASLGGPHGAPHLGACPPGAGPPGGHGVRLGETGYVVRIDLACLDRIAAKHGGRVRLAVVPGALVTPEAPVAHADFHATPDEARALAGAFAVGAERSIEQDPRYGLIVLSEVASRALSSGVNDAGTAISAISRLQRLLALWAEKAAGPGRIDYPNVEAPAATARDLCQDAFGPLARDGAGIVEVGIRLQKALGSLAALGHAELAAAAAEQSDRARQQARQALVLDGDRDEIDRLAGLVADAARHGRSG